jgi:hypothetical protein
MQKLHLLSLIGITFLVVTIIPQVLASTIFPDYGEKECFETKEFSDRVLAEQEYDKWRNALDDKFAGFDFNGISDRNQVSAPLVVCIFTNR